MARQRKTQPASTSTPVDYETVCCVRGCTQALYKRGLCQPHHTQLAKRAGPFARNAPPPGPAPRRKSPLIDGGGTPY